MTRRDQRIEPGLDRLLVQAFGGDVEVQPRLVFADRPAGHAAGDDRTQQMQRRMKTHKAVAARPVDGGGDGFARRRRPRARRRHVYDQIRPLALYRVGDGNVAQVRTQYAGVAGLAAPRGVKHGPVKLDAAFVDHGDHGCAFRGIGVFAKQQCAHGFPSLSDRLRREQVNQKHGRLAL